MPKKDPDPNQDRYQPSSRRQRLIVIAATAATVVVLWLLLIYRPGGHYTIYDPPKPACKPGQTTDCVGGKADVLLLPATPASASGN